MLDSLDRTGLIEDRTDAGQFGQDWADEGKG